MRRLLTGRVHKRPFVVTTVVVSAFLLAGILAVLYLGFFRQTLQTGQIRVESEITGMDINGLGINVGTVPTPNMVLSASFENNTRGQFFTVYEGSEDFVYLLQDGQIGHTYSDGSFVGGTVRIMSLDEQGRMVQKLLADIVDFKESQFGPQTRLDGIGETDSRISFIVSSDYNTIAFSQDGQYITDLTTALRREYQLPIEAEIISASEAGGRFCALSSDWSVYTSTDGKNFNSYGLESLAEEIPKAVISSDKVVIVAGEGGKIRSYCDGENIEIPIMTRADLLAAAGDGQTVLIVGADGTMLTSSNGLVFRALDADERPFQGDSVDWVCATYSDGQYIAVGSSGETALGTYDSSSGRFRLSGFRTKAVRGDTIVPQSVVFDSSGAIMLLTTSGKTFILSEDKLYWKELYSQLTEPVQALGCAADGRVVLFRDEAFYLTRLLTRVEYSEHLTDTTITAGDMCFLSDQTPVFNGIDQQSSDGLWQLYGNAAAAQVVDNAPPSGGSSSLKLYAGEQQGNDNVRFISQILSSNGSAIFFEKTFYRIEVWLKQNEMSEGEVMAWISGDFESVGTVFTDVGNNWRHYSALVVLPAEACDNQSGDIRLNIGFSGKGEIYLDKVFFGPDKFSSEAVPEEYLNVIRDISPDFVRLRNVSFGMLNVDSDSYYSPIGNEGVTSIIGEGYVSQGCVSLESSLRMTRHAGANPWLIIESSAGQEQIEQLMEYLCGSISEPYGKMRIDNGTAVPWSSQFERIVFEMADSDGLFKTDLQKGAFVDFIINVMKSSPHYLDIKDRILFLDGMNYTGGSMLSTADFHSTSLHIDTFTGNVNNTQAFLSSQEIVSAGYLDYYDRIPRILSRPREQLGEWIGSASFRIQKETLSPKVISRSDTRITAAAYVDFILHDLGYQTSMICIDLPVHEGSFDFNRSVFTAPNYLDARENDVVTENTRVMLASLSALTDSVSGAPILVKRLPEISGGEADELEKIESDIGDIDSELATYAFIDGNSVCVIITNTCDEPKQFRIESDFRIDHVVIDHFSETGDIIGSVERRNLNMRFTLLPGQFIVARGTTEES